MACGTSARLKPVLVTSLTIFGGLLPTAYGFGGYDWTLVPLTLAIINDFQHFFGKYKVIKSLTKQAPDK